MRSPVRLHPGGMDNGGLRLTAAGHLGGQSIAGSAGSIRGWIRRWAMLNAIPLHADHSPAGMHWMGRPLVRARGFDGAGHPPTAMFSTLASTDCTIVS